MAKNQSLPGPTDRPETEPFIAQPQAIQKPITDERRFNNIKEVLCDRFKLSVEKCIKNRAFHDGEFDPQYVEHRHFWDSIDRRGKQLTHTEFNCGHKHAIIYDKDSQGQAILSSVKCGPALREVQRVVRSGRKNSTLEAIDFGLGNDGNHRLDEHTHAIEYLKSEKMKIER